ncbi:MAG: phosphotransferase family protein [Acidimicrobiia bacterium]
MTTPPGIDLDALAPFFKLHVGTRPTWADLIAGGRSNLTYEVGDGMRSWVLRRPPLGHVLPTAHDMAREYRVIAALRDTPVPVPPTVAFCDDPNVIGAPFYVMDKVEGRILRTADDASALSEHDARECSRALVDGLAAIHAVDYEAVGLGDFGRPDGYLERQVRRWSEQWERSKTRELPGVDELARRLRAALPTSGAPTIVHGDYRLDNTILDATDSGRIAAVLDWEMATIGDPLTDVGLFLLYWSAPETALVSAAPAATLPGFYSAVEVKDHYATVTGRDLADIDFYLVLAYFKLAIILEGIHARFAMGATVGEGFDELGTMVGALVDGGLRVSDESGIARLRG